MAERASQLRKVTKHAAAARAMQHGRACFHERACEEHAAVGVAHDAPVFDVCVNGRCCGTGDSQRGAFTALRCKLAAQVVVDTAAVSV